MNTEKKKTEIVWGPSNLADHYTCYYCNLANEKVEAGGMWHCPNICCKGPGNAYYRSKLSSFRDLGSQHEIDLTDWADTAEKDVESIENADIKNAAIHWLHILKVNSTQEKFGL